MMDGPFVEVPMYTRLPEALNGRPAVDPPGFPACDSGRNAYGAWNWKARAVPESGRETSRICPWAGKAMLPTALGTAIGDPLAGVRMTSVGWTSRTAIWPRLPTAR